MSPQGGDRTERIAIIGGTGALGGGLALRFARAGLSVIIGSRDPARGNAAATELAASTGCNEVRGMGNIDAARDGEIVIVAVPFQNQRTTLQEIAEAVAGKIVVDTTVPLVPPKVARVQLPKEGSAANVAKLLLGDRANLLTAFHNVSAEKLPHDEPIDCDILVFGDDVSAREKLIGLIGLIGLRGVHGGPLDNSVAAEALTSTLIGINKRYKVEGGAGIRVTGDLRS
ncbi:MAG: NADPH-dependent F420 reductase [Alphaproteobacteria bacterium]|nr:NADPH-dependent F420 reductase [Alphaproteobacteria bacterium]